MFQLSNQSERSFDLLISLNSLGEDDVAVCVYGLNRNRNTAAGGNFGPDFQRDRKR